MGCQVGRTIGTFDIHGLIDGLSHSSGRLTSGKHTELRTERNQLQLSVITRRLNKYFDAVQEWVDRLGLNLMRGRPVHPAKALVFGNFDLDFIDQGRQENNECFLTLFAIELLGPYAVAMLEAKNRIQSDVFGLDSGLFF